MMKYTSFIPTLWLALLLFGGGFAVGNSNDTDFILSVKQWPGKKFIILPKQKVVQSFGYGLYLTPELDCSKRKPNLELETKARRIRCDTFGRSVITAREIKTVGSEYLVKFVHKPKKIFLFGKTHAHAIEGLALFDDLEKARRRWLGKEVFSVRRFINNFDSVTGAMSTRKVKISDPLRVSEIQWGTTPLPPRPLWLIVETVQGTRGFIPIRASWANTMADKIAAARPWDEDLLEQDPKRLFLWDNIIWDAIDSHSILLKMTKQQVRLSWGAPKTIRKDTLGTNNCEDWLFDNEQELHFVGDSLASIF